MLLKPGYPELDLYLVFRAFQVMNSFHRAQYQVLVAELLEKGAVYEYTIISSLITDKENK